MRFLKEIVALVIIILFLIVSDLYIGNLTENATEEVDRKIDYVMENALNKENYKKEEELEKIESLENTWKEVEEKLSYFTEHQELEKVTVAIIGLKANVEANLKEDAYQKMQEIKFRIDHIKAKQKFRLNNIF